MELSTTRPVSTSGSPHYQSIGRWERKLSLFSAIQNKYPIYFSPLQRIRNRLLLQDKYHVESWVLTPHKEQKIMETILQLNCKEAHSKEYYFFKEQFHFWCEVLGVQRCLSGWAFPEAPRRTCALVWPPSPPTHSQVWLFLLSSKNEEASRLNLFHTKENPFL